MGVGRIEFEAHVHLTGRPRTGRALTVEEQRLEHGRAESMVGAFTGTITR